MIKELPKLIDKGVAFTDKDDECYGEHFYESEPVLFVFTDGDVGIGNYIEYCKPDKDPTINAEFNGFTYEGYECSGKPAEIALWVPLAKLKEALSD